MIDVAVAAIEFVAANAVIPLTALVGAFIAGVAIGALYARGRPSLAVLADRVGVLEHRLASLNDKPAILEMLREVESSLPHTGSRHFRALLKAPHSKASDLSDPEIERLVDELIEAFNSNLSVIRDIGKAMVEGRRWSDPDPSVRSRLCREVKTLARKIDLSFWEKRGHLIPNQGIFTNFHRFFNSLKALKSAIVGLSNSPSVEDFTRVAERLVETLQAARAVFDSLRSSA